MAIALFSKGKSESMEIALVTEKLDALVKENEILKAIIQRIDSSFITVMDGVADIKERTENIEAVVFEQISVNHIGKKPVLLESVQDEVKAMTWKEIRTVFNKAANRQQKGYNELYAKLAEITGVDVYSIGKTVITKADKLGFVCGNETYLNTVFKKGVQYEAAAIALDKIRNN